MFYFKLKRIEEISNNPNYTFSKLFIRHTPTGKTYEQANFITRQTMIYKVERSLPDGGYKLKRTDGWSNHYDNEFVKVWLDKYED